MDDRPRVRGLNHLTLAVADLQRSVDFYADLLGCDLRARWKEGAYLSAGDLWLCLSLDGEATPAGGYTHYAFEVLESEFDALCARVSTGAVRWKDNRSEGSSLYVLDPDGHQLEIHVGTLESRLAIYLDEPDLGVTVY